MNAYVAHQPLEASSLCSSKKGWSPIALNHVYRWATLILALAAPSAVKSQLS